MKNSDDLVKVFSAGDNMELIEAQTLLESRGIKCFTRNVATQSLFGMGQIGAGYNLITGPMEIHVLKSYEKQALHFLDELQHYNDEDLDTASENAIAPYEEIYLEKKDVCDEEEKEPYTQNAMRSMLIGVLWFLGVGSLFGIYFGIKALTKDRDSKGIIGIIIGILGVFLSLLFIDVL